MDTILITIAPIFMLIFIGSILRLFKVADNSWVTILNRYGLYVAFPALIIHSLSNASGGSMPDFTIIILNFGLILSIIGIILLVGKIFKTEKSLLNTYVITAFFGNIGYLGFPVISSLIGGSETVISIHIAIYNIILFTAGLAILEHSKSDTHCKGLILKKIITNPLLISVIIGLAIFAFKIQIPAIFNKSIDMIYRSASPVVLFALGIFLIRKIDLKHELKHALPLVFIRIILVPAIFILAWIIFKPGDLFKISILEASMPMAITPFALSEKYPLQKEIISTGILLTTVLSPLSIALIWLIIK